MSIYYCYSVPLLAIDIPLLSAIQFLHEGVQHEDDVHANEGDADGLVETEPSEQEDDQGEDEHHQQQEAELCVRDQGHLSRR